jgi:hypothetical protein
MITRRQATLDSITALHHDPAMMFVLGAITLIAGLAMVLAHNIWSGGVLVVIVTLVGWITLIKALLFLFLPPEMEAGLFLGQLHYQELFYVYGAFSLVLGIYLTYGGFKSLQVGRERRFCDRQQKGGAHRGTVGGITQSAATRSNHHARAGPKQVSVSDGLDQPARPRRDSGGHRIGGVRKKSLGSRCSRSTYVSWQFPTRDNPAGFC